MRIVFIASSLLVLAACAAEGGGDSSTSGTGGSTSHGAGAGGASSAEGTGGSTSTGAAASSSTSSAAMGGATASNGPAGVGGSGAGGGAASGTATIVWSNFTVSQASCWLFSDPTLLGDSGEWSVAAGVATIAFPANGTSYSGSWPASPEVLSGAHVDSFEGHTWEYSEKFQGTVSGNTFTGTWSYTECNSTLDPASCPADGLCVGGAKFVITLPE